MATSFRSVVVGSLVVEAAMALLLQLGKNKLIGTITPGPSMVAWYQRLGFSAVTMDVASLAVGTWLGTQLATSVAGSNIVAQMAGAVAVQIAHDVVFGIYILPHLAPNAPTRIFRTYAEEKGVRILYDDALLMMSAVLCARALQEFEGGDAHAAIGATSLYMALLLLP